MGITGVLAQATVSDLATAEAWYTNLFGGPPDSRPMDGLLEWHLGAGFGVQVWAEAARAGGSTIVLTESDLDGLAARLGGPEPEPGGGARILRLEDPDGNRVVLTGP